MSPSNSTIASATLGAPLAILLCWLVKAFAHTEVPVEVGAAMGGIIGAMAGYLPQGGQAGHVVANSISAAGKQAGRVSIGMLVHFASMGALLVLLLPGGCTTAGGTQMDPTAKIALETTVRIAVRHAVEGNPRSVEKAAHIRDVVAKVQAITTAESTVAALETVVRVEVDKLQLSPLDRADANDLITLLGVALESRFQGPQADKIVQVNELLRLVLSALPAG